MRYKIFTVVKDSNNQMGSLSKEVNTFKEVIEQLAIIHKITLDHNATVISVNAKVIN